MKRILLIVLLSFMAQMFSQAENSLSFDGVNDYVNISSSVTTVTTTQDITVEAWVYPTSNAKTNVIVSKYYGGSSSASNFMVARGTDQKLFISGNGSNVITSNGIIPLNTWTHIAVVFKAGTNNTKIYISGALDISGTLNYNTINSTTNMRIGEFNNIVSYPVYARWSGKIDEMRLWNTARTIEQISGNMGVPLTGTETGLVAYYGFNHGIANGTNTGVTTLSDITAHGWNGTLVSFALTGTTSNWVEGVIFNAPSAPVATQATLVSTVSFSANWNTSLSTTGYYLDVATDSLFNGFVSGFENKDAGNVTTYSVIGLTQGIKYFYRVRAYNSIGPSSNSNVISVLTAAPVVPAAPAAVAATNIAYISFTANWNTSSGADGYYLDVATDDIFTNYEAGYQNRDVANVTSFNVSDLSVYTDYYYRLRAYNAAGTSGNSNVITAKTLYTADPIAVAPSAGDGTIGNPYQIAIFENLYWLSVVESRWDYHYIQTADIDASQTKTMFPNGYGGFYGWGDASISIRGSYNGQFHTIDNLYINRPDEDYIGFFRSANSISNLGVINCDITGKSYVGGLLGAGGNGWSTVNCFTTGSVNGISSVGGLCGINIGYIGGCYSTAKVTGVNNVGGLVGAGYGNTYITNCYSGGTVTGDNTVGGIAGFYGNNDSFPIIEKCYSFSIIDGNSDAGGLIGSVENGVAISCFWDNEVSGITTSAGGGTGKTTAEMKTITTYTDAGWDFSSLWNIDPSSNDGYPYLKWQLFEIEGPANVLISNAGTSVSITWDTVTGATSYKVYASIDPYGTYTDISSQGTFAGTSWSQAISGNKLFYYVVAVKD